MMAGEGIVEVLVGSFVRAPWGWGLTGLVLVTVIRAWPALAQIAVDARAKLRAEKRGDLQSCTEKLELMGTRMAIAEKRLAQFEVRLMAALSAFDLVDTELALTDPEAPARKQARVLLKTAFHAETAGEDIQILLARIETLTSPH